jgi:hypothetical protein
VLTSILLPPSTETTAAVPTRLASGQENER